MWVYRTFRLYTTHHQNSGWATSIVVQCVQRDIRKLVEVLRTEGKEKEPTSVRSRVPPGLSTSTIFLVIIIPGHIEEYWNNVLQPLLLDEYFCSKDNLDAECAPDSDDHLFLHFTSHLVMSSSTTHKEWWTMYLWTQNSSLSSNRTHTQIYNCRDIPL